MGASKNVLKDVVIAVRQVAADAALEQAQMNLATPGGRIQVEWDTRDNATTMGQLAFFAEFLDTAGLFERWVAQCPLHFTSPNAPKVRDVLGTWMLAILDGHRRYAHTASLRGDAVVPQLLGMREIVGEESLRRALKQIAPAPNRKHNVDQKVAQEAQVKLAENWMSNALLESVQHALTTAWILDTDTTIKTLFGHQSGAEISYNPHKPGRPSHAIHTYWIANLRLVLKACVQGGKSHSSAHTLPGLKELIVSLPKEQRPQLVRGDCAFGNEVVMVELEEIEQPYLFKLKQTANVKKLIQRLWQRYDWRDAGQGWEGCEDTLKLLGWSRARRVIVLRRAIKADVVAEVEKTPKAGRKSSKMKKAESAQLSLYFTDIKEPAKLWEYAVLVTNSAYQVEAMGQLYRDRADCENGFDELKNQWGWGGYSTQDIERCNLSAQAVALVYNWWSWYCRLAHPQARMEAITSRPLLLAAVGRITAHAGKTRVLLSITHAAVDHVKALVTNIRAGLMHIRTTAPQLSSTLRWRELVHYIIDKILTTNRQKHKNTPSKPMLFSG